MKVAFFDIDGTLTNKPLWLGFTEYFKSKRVTPIGPILFWAYHIPLYLLYKLKLLSQYGYRQPWAKHLPWYFRGMSVAQADEMWDWIITHFIPDVIWKDSLALVQRHLEAGDLVIFISASPEPIIQRIAELYGVSHVIATKPKLKHGKFTGGIVGDVCSGENKVKFARAYLSEMDVEVDLQASYAYADSSGDVYLLEFVGNPVATHPDEEMIKIANNRNWKIFPEKK